jgi:hypothetical protein
MNRGYAIIERAASVVVAAAFMVIGLLLMVLGVTFLPAFGILAALPLMGISLHFLSLRPELSVAHAEKRAPAIIYLEHEDHCPWPPVSCCPWPLVPCFQEAA